MDPISALIVVFVVVTVTGGLAFSLYTIMYPVQTAADRLESLTTASEAKNTQVDITNDRVATTFELIASRLGQLAQTKTDGAPDPALEKLRSQLKHAGYKNRRAADIFNGLRVGLLGALPVLLSPLGFVMSVQATAFAMVIAAIVGYYMPVIRLGSMAQDRQRGLLRSYPDALDLLVSCVDSGLGLDAAFRRVAVEMTTVAPDLAREFAFVNSEISAGVERMISLRHLADRTGLEEVRSLVNMLSQAERFGSSVADSLRMYSSVAREKRMSKAEEKAGAVGSKITIVMIIFFLPVLMVILMAPAAIRMME